MRIMLGQRKLIVDTHCDIYEILKSHADEIFWDFSKHTVVPGAVYIIGREQFKLNADRIIELTDQQQISPVLCNPVEGSETILGQVSRMGILNHVRQGKILIVGGGDMEPEIKNLTIDLFLIKILQFKANLEAQNRTQEIFTKLEKPYKFLFLNGRSRPNRKYLLERFDQNGLLSQALWTNLDSSVAKSRHISYNVRDQDLMTTPRNIQLLPKQYEVARYQDRVDLPLPDDRFVKNHLFDNKWGDIYIGPDMYIDTYFSLVTETVFSYPYSFRTEKIWKPVAMGHPWIAVANMGYYRDMRNLGFQTFGHLIDETFDSIDNDQDRIERIAEVVEDLCQQDLCKFLAEAKSVCKYNQLFLASQHKKTIQAVAPRIFDFISQHFL